MIAHDFIHCIEVTPQRYADVVSYHRWHLLALLPSHEPSPNWFALRKRGKQNWAEETYQQNQDSHFDCSSHCCLALMSKTSISLDVLPTLNLLSLFCIKSGRQTSGHFLANVLSLSLHKCGWRVISHIDASCNYIYVWLDDAQHCGSATIHCK